MVYEINELRKIGLSLIGFGFFFSFLGVILFFDRGLLALGNIFCLSGVAVLLGWHSTWNLLTNRANYKGSASFLLGLVFLFLRWPIVGIILEIYGCIVLFGGFWPSIKVFLNQIPVIGWIIHYPFLNFLPAMNNDTLSFPNFLVIIGGEYLLNAARLLILNTIAGTGQYLCYLLMTNSFLMA